MLLEWLLIYLLELLWLLLLLGLLLVFRLFDKLVVALPVHEALEEREVELLVSDDCLDIVGILRNCVVIFAFFQILFIVLMITHIIIAEVRLIVVIVALTERTIIHGHVEEATVTLLLTISVDARLWSQILLRVRSLSATSLRISIVLYDAIAGHGLTSLLLVLLHARKVVAEELSDVSGGAGDFVPLDFDVHRILLLPLADELLLLAPLALGIQHICLV